MRNNKYDELSKYIIIGVIIGLFIGVVFSIVMRNNTFLAISSPGFGLSFGVLIANIIWCVRNHKK